MMHAGKAYQRIQDPSGKIPKDEPVFLLRAQDPTFIPMLRMYQELGRMMGMDPKMIQVIEVHIQKAKLWPVRKPVADM